MIALVWSRWTHLCRKTIFNVAIMMEFLRVYWSKQTNNQTFFLNDLKGAAEQIGFRRLSGAPRLRRTSIRGRWECVYHKSWLCSGCSLRWLGKQLITTDIKRWISTRWVSSPAASLPGRSVEEPWLVLKNYLTIMTITIVFDHHDDQ